MFKATPKSAGGKATKTTKSPSAFRDLWMQVSDAFIGACGLLPSHHSRLSTLLARVRLPSMLGLATCSDLFRLVAQTLLLTILVVTLHQGGWHLAPHHPPISADHLQIVDSFWQTLMLTILVLAFLIGIWRLVIDGILRSTWNYRCATCNTNARLAQYLGCQSCSCAREGCWHCLYISVFGAQGGAAGDGAERLIRSNCCVPAAELILSVLHSTASL